MGFFKFFRSRGDDASAKMARDRLQVLIAHQRSGRNAPDYLPALRRDLLEVIKKYVNVGEEQVSVSLDNKEDYDVLELNITLPDDEGGGRDGESRRSALMEKASAALAESPDSGRRTRSVYQADDSPRRRKKVAT